MIEAMHKEVKALVRRLRAAGCSVIPGGKHLTVRDPEGRRVGTLPVSPSDTRSLRNTISDLRKRGIEL